MATTDDGTRRALTVRVRGSRASGRQWYAVYVETPQERPDRMQPGDSEALRQNIALAESLGATLVRVSAERPADGLTSVRDAAVQVVPLDQPA